MGVAIDYLLEEESIERGSDLVETSKRVYESLKGRPPAELRRYIDDRKPRGFMQYLRYFLNERIQVEIDAADRALKDSQS
tara:strand:+ start:799 stop:1038 length:240 start_codon:yes stop_codon:yes gene_type:complete